ncbi:MAG: hypothetical protein JSV25_12925 [Spirochaetota bacterium]|nr:MAG: hypothetical protein JSV25_12925 [Spirochaetota bacterium]
MKYTTIIFILLLTLIGTSCATLKTEEGEVVSEGITGILVPVDAYGNEIVFQEKEKILVNLTPIEDGERFFDNTLTFNPRPDGSFASKLDDGNYAVEIFLDGFYVKNFEITVNENEILDLGVINIEKIETEIAAPLKEGHTEEVIINEGDVNIEPPSI